MITQAKVTVRLTVSQSVSLGVEPQARYLLLLDSYGLVFLGLPLCCLLYMLLAPRQRSLIFYCLRFEISLLVASYDS
jgi:hypothetical protein